MEDTVPNPCISCGKEVRIRQQGLQCDDCMRWQHRTCGTGITQSEYRTAARNNGVIDWTCNDCTTGREASVDIAHFSVTMSQTLSTTTSSNPNQTYNATQNSFNIEQSFQTPSDPEEESMLSNIHNATAESDQNDTTESDSMEVDVEIEYKIIENGTKRGKPKLVSSDGFSYTLKRQTTRATHWFCSHRPKSGKCPATIAQIGEAFNEGPHQHNHAPDNISHIEITARMRELAQRNSNIFTPAASMAEDLMKEEYVQLHIMPKIWTSSHSQQLVLLIDFLRDLGVDLDCWSGILN